MKPGEAPHTVVCVGRLYCDLIFTDVPRMPSLGTETFAGDLGLHAGGGAFITAAWLSALGHRSGLACFLPPPPFDRQIAAEIERAGVDASLSAPSPPQQAPQMTVAIATGGDRAFLSHKPGPPFPPVSAGALRHVHARHVHIGEVTTLIERPELLRAAQDAGVTVSLDCGWDDGVQAAELARLLPQIDVFLPNEAEVQLLREHGVSIDAPGLTVTKRGAGGASALRDGADLHVPAVRTDVVDTTGAGDAFNAGFLSAWLARAPLEACLKAGTQIGAKAVAQRGGFMPQSAQGGSAAQTVKVSVE